MTAPSTTVASLLTPFGLTTAAEELVPRLTHPGHPEAMSAFETLDTGRFPAVVAQQLETLATGAFLEAVTNVLPLASRLPPA